MRTLDPIAHIRSHPGMYLPGGVASPADLASRLSADALLLGASRTLVVHDGEWWAVAADADWFSPAPIPADELFRRIVPFPEAGVNSMRSEVLLTAFADDVLTWGEDDAPHRVKGAADDWQRVRTRFPDGNWKRVVVFKLELVKPVAPDPGPHAVASSK